MDQEQPRQVLVVDGVSIRRQPPIVGDWCNTPRSGRADWDCGYKAGTCKGQKRVCPRCHFGFCERHFPGHFRGFYAPPDAWNRMMTELREEMKAAAKDPSTPIYPPRLTDAERQALIGVFEEEDN